MARSKRNRSTRRDEPLVASRVRLPKVIRFATPWSTVPQTEARAPTRRGPLVSRPASFSSTAATPRAPGAARARAVVAKVARLNPQLLVCAKRAIRKQVLHALGQAGRAGQRRPRFTAASKVKCP